MAEFPGSTILESEMSELELLKQELFGDPATAISDISFFPTKGSTASVEEVAATVRAAIIAVRNGEGRDVDLSV